MCILYVKLKPNSRKNEIVGLKNDVLVVKVAEAPVNGKANNALIVTLSKRLHIPKGSISIKRGFKASLKQITINSIDKLELMERLRRL